MLGHCFMDKLVRVSGACFIIIAVGVCLQCDSLAQTTGSGLRNPLKQPFEQRSIWNMPIGSEAKYVPANIVLSENNHMTVDEDVIILTPDAPMTDVKYCSVGWNRNRNRCIADGDTIYRVPIPPDFVYSPDTWDGLTPNACAAVLMPDRRTLHQFQPFARCYPGQPATGKHKYDTVDLYGDGTYGAHGGSALSSIGGTIRLGELVPGGRITHVMKMNLHCWKNFYYAKDETDQKPGYRWPARKADSSAPRSYQGKNPVLQMGSLLALKPDFDVSVLESEPGRILAQAFIHYGAYTVDSTGWDVYALCTEHSPDGKMVDEFKRVWGHNFSGTGTDSGWKRDYMKIIQNLHVVDSNGPDGQRPL